MILELSSHFVGYLRTSLSLSLSHWSLEPSFQIVKFLSLASKRRLYRCKSSMLATAPGQSRIRAKGESGPIFNFYMGKNTPERKDYIMERLVVPVEE